ncbi:hypothetical protein J2Y48_003433 [Mycoplana sp. BE70]|nr:hypothetical protein [Mycoplana sp. BE70]MDR6758135.1 hypothetical protein [Mycoplana sp. BE70]
MALFELQEHKVVPRFADLLPIVFGATHRVCVAGVFAFLFSITFGVL